MTVPASSERRRRKGFSIPHRYADRIAAIDYPTVARLFDGKRMTFARSLELAESFAQDFVDFSGQPPEPRWDQDWFPRVDGAMAYAMARRFAPRRVIELGAGHSTRFLARGLRDADVICDYEAIDPQPRANIGGLDVRLATALLQRVDLALFHVLRPGDLLSVDTSHIAMPGSDVDIIYSRLLPTLPRGLLVHFHDVFLPDPYPTAWAWRGYNEQLLTAAWLLTGRLEPLFASRYVLTRMRDRFAKSPLARLPLVEGAVESSLWALLT